MEQAAIWAPQEPESSALVGLYFPSQEWSALSGRGPGSPTRRYPAPMSDDPIKLKEFLTAEGAEDWRVTAEGAVAFYRTESLAMSANLVAALTDVAGLAEHQFGIDIRQEGVTVRVVTLRDDYMGMTQRDLELARAIQVVARGMGLTADPSVLQSILIVPGAPS